MKGYFTRGAMVAGLAAAITAPAGAATVTFQIDPVHSTAQFGVTHLMISTVRGEFKGLKGTVVWDEQDPADSTVSVTIDANTVNTQEPDRDKHLKSPDFFDVAKYPTMSFESTKVEQVLLGN